MSHSGFNSLPTLFLPAFVSEGGRRRETKAPVFGGVATDFVRRVTF